MTQLYTLKNYIEYKAHFFLHSRYKIIITFLIIFLFSFLFNTNNITSYAICEENSQPKNDISEELYNKLMGTGLFLLSITLFFLITNLSHNISPEVIEPLITSSVDLVSNPSSIDLTSNTQIDDFIITTGGQIMVDNQHVDPNSYLLAETVTEQLHIVTAERLKELMLPIQEIYHANGIATIDNVPIDNVSIPDFFKAHLKMTDSNLEKMFELSIQNSQQGGFIKAILRDQLITERHLALYELYLQRGGNPNAFSFSTAISQLK